jgi:asparagine synthase (glutamine-hydrolysing)
MQAVPSPLRQNGFLRKISRLAEVPALPAARRYCQWVEHFGPAELDQLYAPSFAKEIGESDADSKFADIFARTETDEWLDAVLEADVHLYLADDLLVKMDRATMSHSLEARSPFLDHVFMEFAATLPVKFKQAWGQKKRLLKASLRGRVSDELLDRPKMGFSIPLAKWFREDLWEVANDLLMSPRALQRRYFDKEEVVKLLTQHRAGKADHGTKLWDLLMLELWHLTLVDPQFPSRDLAEPTNRIKSMQASAGDA